MRILFDHCVPKRLRKSFASHQVRSVSEMGWQSLRNGTLLAIAANKFDVMLTIDQNIAHQQNLLTLPLAIIVINSKTNKLKDLIAIAPSVHEALLRIQPRTLVEVS